MDAWTPDTLRNRALPSAWIFMGKTETVKHLNHFCFGSLVISPHLQHQNIFSFCKSQQLPPLTYETLVFCLHGLFHAPVTREHSGPTSPWWMSSSSSPSRLLLRAPLLRAPLSCWDWMHMYEGDEEWAGIQAKSGDHAESKTRNRIKVNCQVRQRI